MRSYPKTSTSKSGGNRKGVLLQIMLEIIISNTQQNSPSFIQGKNMLV